MKQGHPSDWEIQEYALDNSGCAFALTVHIESCAECGEAVKNYQILFSAVNLQASPTFDFDLSSSVLAQLPSVTPRLTADQFIVVFLVLFICCFVSVPLILFNKYILNMFSGISPFFMYAIIGTAVVNMIYKTLELYRKFQKQMKLINFN